MARISISFIHLLIIASLLIVLASASNYTLKSLSVVFRHGDRTPLEFPTELYPSDPYRNDTFYPIGNGGLTNTGKLRGYNLGKSLRERYDEFLGKIYIPANLSVRSTNTDRTKMSLLLVLAGLYPPTKEQKWSDSLNWQPIPVANVPHDMDPIFVFYNCPIYKAELERVKNTTEFQDDLKQFSAFMKELSIHTGKDVTNTEFIYYLFHTLMAEKSMNLTIPDWTKPYFPNGSIVDAAIFEYGVQSYNQKLTKLNGGMALRKILDSMLEFINGTNTNVPKVNLYSAHENNIAGILKAMNVWKKFIPEYSSAIICELHEKNSTYYIKTLYYKGIPAEYEEQILPGCSKYCPIEDFIRITKDVLPDDIMEACFGPSLESHLVPDYVNPVSWLYNKIKIWFSF